MFPVSEEALSETAESTSDEVVMDVLAETEETVLTGTEDAAPVQADNKTVKAVETAKITLRIKSPRKNQGNGKARAGSAPRFPPGGAPAPPPSASRRFRSWVP